MGAFGWSNVARVFDAVKVIYQPHDKIQLDTFFSQVVDVNRVKPDSGTHNDNFYGLYLATKPWVDYVLDVFFFARHTKNNEIVGELSRHTGQLKEYTIGSRFKGKYWRFDYGVEWAAQFGSRAHEPIHAWAGHNEVGYTMPKLPWQPRLYFEFNHASGDDNPTDGRWENFDNLYPTNHLHYGYMDFASWRNMNNLRLGVQANPHKKVKLQVDYHWFGLDTNASAWFNAGQSAIRNRTVGASRTAGNEIDLLMNLKLSKTSWSTHRLFAFSCGALCR